MTPELWQRLKPLFYAALDRPIEERMAYIDEVCGTDGELKTHLVQLIQAAQEETATADRPLVRLFQPRPMRFSSGEIILERFRIVRPIGSGGMGEVYEAEDMQLGRVALKTIRDQIASSPGVFSRFRQEVQLARKVSGAQVCRIHELHLLPAAGGHGATAFLTMEYLEGVTLAEKLKRDGPFPLKEALRIALDICEGLKLVHGNGVIHRDLKCANIMLCGEGDSLRAVLMDFGLARDFSASVSSADGTADSDGGAGTVAGAIMGTPAYMAPEQFESNPVSTATDIYALGIVLYELVTGIHPYAAPTPVAAAIRRAHIPARPSKIIRSVPRKWDRIINRCLEYDAADRYQSAEEVARALRAGPADFVNFPQDRPLLFWLAAALLVAATAWGALALWQQMQYYRPNPDAQRPFDEGVAALHEWNNVKATRLFEESISNDQHFAMAYARRAEALFNLDFQGDAFHWLSYALPGRAHLHPPDVKRLDAINASIDGDTAGAVEQYKNLLDELPQADKSSAEVDLGLAYQRDGDIPNALAAYTRAATADKNNPAAFIHIGVLESRQHHVAQGNEAFEQARKIFDTEINAEGIAELDYEMGYAANDRGDSPEAEPILARSLDEAQKIPSPQLEIRALCQLSSAESADSKDEQALAHAQRAIDLAHRNNLEPWAAAGLVRLANAQIAQSHFKEAEPPLTEAIETLKGSPQPRIQALANVALASLMQQEQHPDKDKVAELARTALDYYKKNGFSEGAFTAALLLARGERDKGQYKQAQEDSDALLAAAYQRQMKGQKFQAEDMAGTVHFRLEKYPDALFHFRKAKDFASDDIRRSYDELRCGLVEARLGDYTGSEQDFSAASNNPALKEDVDERRIESLISQEQYQSALSLAHRSLSGDQKLTAGQKQFLIQLEALAEAHLGLRNQAASTLSQWLSMQDPKPTSEDSAQIGLLSAEVHLLTGSPQLARDEAAQALNYFDASGQLDSELKGATLAAQAALAMKDKDAYDLFAKKVVDILSKLRETWGPDPFRSYLARPDIHAATLRNQRDLR
jgi:hypothetical protein